MPIPTPAITAGLGVKKFLDKRKKEKKKKRMTRKPKRKDSMLLKNGGKVKKSGAPHNRLY